MVEDFRRMACRKGQTTQFRRRRRNGQPQMGQCFCGRQDRNHSVLNTEYSVLIAEISDRSSGIPFQKLIRVHTLFSFLGRGCWRCWRLLLSLEGGAAAVAAAGAGGEELVEAAVLAEQRGSHVEDRFGALRIVPKLFRTFDLQVEFLDQRFHQRRGDRQAQAAIARIIDPLHVVGQIGQPTLDRTPRVIVGQRPLWRNVELPGE